MSVQAGPAPRLIDVSEHILLSLAIILVLGVSAQWLASRVRLPSILLLLSFGLIAGAAGWVDPDAVFGDLLMPVVSISVALILYEGGLTLKFSELPAVGRVVWSLVTLGALVTWMGTTVAAQWIFDLPTDLAAVIGAVLVVTGPTVIGPLLRHIRPSGSVGPILRWEGIVIDPIGALATVLIFEGLYGEAGQAARHAVMSVAKTVVFGGGLGVAAAALLTLMLARYWIADYLQNAVSLMFVVAAFVGANHLQEESGLAAVTVMGVVLANQSKVDVRHIAEFKENLQVLLISGLFIVLAARLELNELELDVLLLRGGLFVAALVIVVRPLSVFVSTWRSKLSLREKWFLSWMAPRGIVAAAVASVFALRLEQRGVEGAQLMVQITFVTIIATVAIYGLSSPWVARRLKVAQSNPQGILMIGAHAFARELAAALKREGFHCVLLDTNRDNTRAARMAGLSTFTGGVLDDHTLDRLDLGGIGRLFAMTPNPWINILAVHRFERIFGKAACYKLAPPSGNASHSGKQDTHGRTLFGAEASYADLSRRLAQGRTVKVTRLTEEFNFEAYRARYGESALMLLVITASGALEPVTTAAAKTPEKGQRIVAMVEGEEEKGERGEKGGKGEKGESGERGERGERGETG